MENRPRCTIPAEIAACIGDGRVATWQEVSRLADRVLQDIFGLRLDENIGSDESRTSHRIAHLALHGTLFAGS